MDRTLIAESFLMGFQGAQKILPQVDSFHAGAKPLNVAFWYELSRSGIQLSFVGPNFIV